MKKVAGIVVIIVLVSIGYTPNVKAATSNQIDTVAHYLLSVPDAQKILGQPTKLTGRTTKVKEGVTQYQCTYLAGPETVAGSRPCYLYYSLERHAEVAKAQKLYADMLASNSGMAGVKTLSGVGDEAWLHTDSNNFVLLIVRKGNALLRLKINKLTSKVSTAELQNAASRMAAIL
jgi:hypothetical protein